MFDPLSSNNATWGGTDDVEPSWPTVPHPPNSPIPNLRRASTPGPPSTPEKGPAPGLYGKEPQIYGQPESGLISPRDTVGSSGNTYEKPEPYLRVKITAIDRNRRDTLIKLDAQTNLSNFTGTTYRNVSRSYIEFQAFYEAIIHSNPQTIIPALPLAQTSAPTDEEDDRLVRIMLQRWFTRVCEDPIMIHDEDLRSFIESDFGYQPTPRPRRKTSSGFGLMRRGVPDEDEELQRARFELTKLEGQFFDTAKAVDKLAMTRKALASAHTDMGNKLLNVATTEAHPPLGNAFRKIGRTWHSLADLDQAQAISECVIIGDSLGYQGLNARSAKETLQMRTGVLEEYQAAVKTTISKRRQIERLKASSNIRAERVDEALEEIKEASKYEEVLAKRAEGISQNLHRALETHNGHVNDDVTAALIEHARSSIMYERQLLRELEALRSDVANAANKVAPSSTIPKPTVILPLEEPIRPLPPPAPTPMPNDYRREATPPRTQSPQIKAVPAPPPGTSDPLSSVPSGPPSQPSISPSPSQQTVVSRGSVSTTSSFASRQAQFSPSVPSSPRQPLPAQSPGAGPSTPTSERFTATKPPVEDGPPLGGRFVDGTKSMFVNSSSPLVPPSPTASTFSRGGDPLMVSGPPVRPSSALDGKRAMNGNPLQNDLDPLGLAKPNYMTSSLRVQPTRPRLDAKEAASKLANMF
ncbi:Vps5 C terminal like-domain-containing protein [Lentinula raphanica]|uniref:Vps5 C terminal like-domain-containing protein n=1 Tax=Lentinula raphanica TaxID=153919 RepID=A0AA38NYY9_9AGAR|nr:Vps5 C terminal like-domain-containing protein [Lentinula raphanica]